MMTSHTPSALPEPRGFDYTTLDSQTRVVVQQRTSELKSLIRRTAQNIIEIGQTLIEVREELGYGNFRKWLKDEFSWSHPTATRFIQVAKHFSCINLMQVEIAASALYLLARPSTPEEARQEALERATQGEPITYKAAKEIYFHHTINVDAETVEEESPDPAEAPPVPQSWQHLEPLDESIPSGEIDTSVEAVRNEAPMIADQTEEGLLEDKGDPEPSLLQVGDRVRILRHQHGKDIWSGKTAQVWQITSDGWLRVDVEGHEGVRFTLNLDWVEHMEEETPEQQGEQPEQALVESQADVDELENEPEASIELSVASKQSQDKQQTNLERRARVTLTLKGEQVKVEGIITHVHLKWQHGDLTEDMQVPIGEVEFVN